MQNIIFYEELFERLQYAGLSDVADLESLRPDWGGTYSSGEYGWVSELYGYVSNSVGAAIEDFARSSSVPIFFDRHYVRDHQELIKDQSMRANYACLFPRRVTYFSHIFYEYTEDYLEGGSGHVSTIPIDYLLQAFLLKPLLLRGFAFLAPLAVKCVDSQGGPGVGRITFPTWTAWDRYNAEGTVLLGSGSGTDFAVTLQSKGLSNQLLRTPWLRGVDLDSYADLIYEEQEAFLMYELATSRIMRKGADPVDSIQDVIEEIEVATLQLERAFKIKKESLSFRGATVSLGSLVTIGSFLAPADLKSLAAGVGGATLVQAATWLRDRRALSSELDKNDYWFLWKSLK